jgi:phosphoenolpyruvate carboxylase
VTEQGEVLSTRYHDPDLAFRIIEQMAYGVLLGAEAAQKEAQVPEAWRAAMTEMSSLAYQAYEALVHKDPEFIEFWKIATPIEEIGGLKLGSRPTFRRATKSVEDLRAIPWVFSWMQSRFVFPGWYGLGSALEQFAAKGPEQAELLRTMYKEWMFFKATIDNAQLTLLKADMQIAFHYALLVPDEAIRVRIFDIIAEEFSRTEHAILAITGQKALLEREPVLAKSVQLRNPYIDPLNYIQVEMIRRLRGLEDKTSTEAEELRAVIELTINGVSGGLKNTG